MSLEKVMKEKLALSVFNTTVEEMGTSPLTCTEEEPSFDNSWLIIAFKGAIKITIEDFPVTYLVK
jgi:hypothetical protein